MLALGHTGCIDSGLEVVNFHLSQCLLLKSARKSSITAMFITAGSCRI